MSDFLPVRGLASADWAGLGSSGCLARVPSRYGIDAGYPASGSTIVMPPSLWNMILLTSSSLVQRSQSRRNMYRFRFLTAYAAIKLEARRHTVHPGLLPVPSLQNLYLLYP